MRNGDPLPGGLLIIGVLSLTSVTVTEMVAVPVRGGAASSIAITYIGTRNIATLVYVCDSYTYHPNSTCNSDNGTATIITHCV